MKAVRDATAKVLDATSLASLRRQVERASELTATHLNGFCTPRLLFVDVHCHHSIKQRGTGSWP